MKHKDCPLAGSCAGECLPYLKQCITYKKLVTAQAVRKTGIKFTQEVEEIIKTKKFNPSGVSTLSSSEALAALIVLVMATTSPVRAYTYLIS